MHVFQEFQHTGPYMRGRSIQDFFDEKFQMQIFRFANYPKGHCIYCGGMMQYHEQNPPGRITPRSMHDGCFAQLRAQMHGYCIVCGYKVTEEQKQGQARNPIDIHNWVHKSENFPNAQPCKDYFVVVSAHGLGIETGLLEAQGWIGHSHDPNIITKDGPAGPRQLPAPPRRALPEPGQRTTADDIIRQFNLHRRKVVYVGD